MKHLKPFDPDYISYINKIIEDIPDSDIPPEVVFFKNYKDYIIFVEGWSENCFSNYDLGDREDMVEFAKEIYLKRLQDQPYLPQNKKLRGYTLIDHMFKELPDNEILYCVSIGIYKNKKDSTL